MKTPMADREDLNTFEADLDVLLRLWNLDPVVRVGAKTEAAARGLLRG
jgi:hypothetical protein